MAQVGKDGPHATVDFHKQVRLPDPPTTYWEATRGLNVAAWREAMDVEMANMRQFDVFDLVPAPPHGTNSLKCRWVFAFKIDDQAGQQSEGEADGEGFHAETRS